VSADLLAANLRPTVYVASGNAGKLGEITVLFAVAPFRLATWPGYRAPDEGETSYADNAALKARVLWEQLRAAGTPAHVLADDSGLEVRALSGRPGVQTAFYGGAGLPWSERRGRLIAELDATGSADRSARFVCALHFVSAGGREFTTVATVDGEIATAERGTAGFSFDPIFVWGPEGRTFAEMAEEEKNRVSHRAIAAAGLLTALRAARIFEHESGQVA
jgi:XTP/dITP diphosphohydrolase